MPPASTAEELEVKHEYHTFTKVSASSEKGLLMLCLAIWGWAIHPADPIVGGQIAGSTLLGPGIWGILIGSLLLVVLVGLSGVIGFQTRLPSAIVYMVPFGRVGRYIPQIVLWFLVTAWTSFAVGVTADLLKASLGLSNPVWHILFSFVLAALFLSSALFGIKGLAYLAGFASPLLVAGVVYAAARATAQGNGWAAVAALPAKETAWAGVAASPLLWVVGLSVSSWVALALYGPDYFRYAKRSLSSFSVYLIAAFGLFFGKSLMQITGLITGKALGAGDITVVVTGWGLAGLAFLIYLGATWTSADNCYYSGSLSLSAMTKLPKLHTLLISAFCVFLGAAAGAHFFILQLVILSGNLTAPLVGVLLADYYISSRYVVRKSYDNPAETALPGIRWTAVLAVLIGLVIDLHMQGTVGRSAITGGGILAINGIVAAGIAYVILEKVAASTSRSAGAERVRSTA